MSEVQAVKPAAGRQRRFDRDFSRLWLASAASAVGDGMTLAAAPLLASRLTHDARLIGGVAAVATIPFVLFGVPAGWLVDRVDIRAGMARVDFARTVVMATLAAGVGLGLGGLPLLYTCIFLVGTGEVFFRGAAQMLVPAIASDAALTTANARIIAAQEAGSSFFGPLAGAALFVSGTALPFGVDSASFLCSAVLLSRLARPSAAALAAVAARPASGPISGMFDGVRWLWRHRVLRTLALFSCAVNMVGTASLAVLVVYAREVLHLDSFGYGVLLACQAAGAVAAARLAGVLSNRFGPEGALAASAMMTAAGEALIAGLASPYPAAFALALFACATVVWNVASVGLRQTLVPQPLRGRVNAACRLVAWGGLPVGAVAGGFLADAAGPAAVYAAGAVGMAIIATCLTVGARRQWITRAVAVDGGRDADRKED